MLSIFEKLKNEGENFTSFYREIVNIPAWTVIKLLDIYYLNIRDVISQYTNSMIELVPKVFAQ